MVKSGIIAKKEYSSYFDSLMAYILILLFLAITGYFTWIYEKGIFYTNQASLTLFFNWAYWTLFFFIPTITMGVLSEEYRSGTIEILGTKKLHYREIIAGKFFAAWGLAITAIFLTLPFYFILTSIGETDPGTVIGGYLALIFISGAYTAIGVMAGSFTSNTLVAALLALFFSSFFHFIFDLVSANISGMVADILYFLSFKTHFGTIEKGVLGSKNIIFFITLSLLALFVATISLQTRLSGKGFRKMGGSFAQLLIVVSILVFINLIGDRFNYRADLTAGNKFSLSPITTEILENLPHNISATAYFSDNLPPRFNHLRQNFEEMLEEYREASDGRFKYTFINPARDNMAEDEAILQGIEPIIVDIRKRDELRQQRIFMGVILRSEDRSETISSLQPDESFEYLLTRSVKKLSLKDKPALAIIRGNGEAGKSSLDQPVKKLSSNFNIKEIDISGAGTIPSDIRTALIINPRDSFNNIELNKLEDFLRRGGNFFIAYSRVDADLLNQRASLISTGLESWLYSKGVLIRPAIIADALCGTIKVKQKKNGEIRDVKLKFPYFPVISSFAEHRITNGLETLFLPYCNELAIDANKSKNIKVLASTSKLSATYPLPHFLDVYKDWEEKDFPTRNLPVAVLIKSGIKSDGSIVLIANENFAENEDNNYKIPEENVDFMANSVDWLSDLTDLIPLRTRRITYHPLEQLDPDKKLRLQYTAVSLPLILLLILGIGRVIYTINKKKRL